MSMEKAIREFPKQFLFDPKIENAAKLKKAKKIIVAGMGGSRLAAELLRERNPELGIAVHKSYGLPALPKKDLQESLLIASSYSGNTEETIDAFNAALKRKMAVAVLSTGGKLIELAKKAKVPYVSIPTDTIQPRSALGFSLRGLMKLAGDEKGLKETEKLFKMINPSALEKEGQSLARELRGHIPIVYSSLDNEGIAMNWRVRFNETGKIPAYHNVFPELNHNEMTGLDAIDSTKPLSEKMFFIFLKDSADHPRIQKRMALTKKLYEDRGLKVKILNLEGKSVPPSQSFGEPRWEKIFNSILLADWAAYHTALLYGAEPEEVPMVEEFKGLMKN